MVIQGLHTREIRLDGQISPLAGNFHDFLDFLQDILKDLGSFIGYLRQNLGFLGLDIGNLGILGVFAGLKFLQNPPNSAYFPPKFQISPTFPRNPLKSPNIFTIFHKIAHPENLAFFDFFLDFGLFFETQGFRGRRRRRDFFNFLFFAAALFGEFVLFCVRIPANSFLVA